MHAYSTNFDLLFRMVDWTFEDALMAIPSLPLILTSVLQSADGLHLGDICFVKIQTTLWMHTMPIAVLEKWAEDGSFNLEHMAEGDYSHTTAILILLNPNVEGAALESTSVRLIVWWCNGPVGHIHTIMKLIKYVHSLMEVEGQSSEPVHMTICTNVGNLVEYGICYRPSVLHSLSLVFCLQRWSTRWLSWVSRIIPFPLLEMFY